MTDESNFHRDGAMGAKTQTRWFFRVPRALAVCFCFSCAQQVQLARVELKCSQGQLAVDGAPSGEVSGKTRLSLRPGHHVFELRSEDGSLQVREADLGPGDLVALDLGGGSK